MENFLADLSTFFLIAFFPILAAFCIWKSYKTRKYYLQNPHVERYVREKNAEEERLRHQKAISFNKEQIKSLINKIGLYSIKELDPHLFLYFFLLIICYFFVFPESLFLNNTSLGVIIFSLFILILVTQETKQKWEGSLIQKVLAKREKLALIHLEKEKFSEFLAMLNGQPGYILFENSLFRCYENGATEQIFAFIQGDRIKPIFKMLEELELNTICFATRKQMNIINICDGTYATLGSCIKKADFFLNGVFVYRGRKYLYSNIYTDSFIEFFLYRLMKALLQLTKIIFTLEFIYFLFGLLEISVSFNSRITILLFIILILLIKKD